MNSPTTRERDQVAGSAAYSRVVWFLRATTTHASKSHDVKTPSTQPYSQGAANPVPALSMAEYVAMETPVRRAGTVARPATAGFLTAHMPASRSATPASSIGDGLSPRITTPATTASNGALPLARG